MPQELLPLTLTWQLMEEMLLAMRLVLPPNLPLLAHLQLLLSKFPLHQGHQGLLIRHRSFGYMCLS